MESAKIKIFREKAYGDSFRKYKVFLNGKKVGEISEEETFLLSVEPGDHEIFLKIDWCRSPKMRVNIVEKETVEMVCHGRSSLEAWFVLFYILLSPWKYIALKFKEK